MNVNDLLPCPFCGENADLVHINSTTTGLEFWDVYCECGATIGKSEDIEYVVSHWNRRSLARLRNG